MPRSRENTKYEITDIAHRQYPFLYRIRALRAIGDKVRAGELGGFVESEQNLAYEPEDEAWLFGDSICCNEARVDKNSFLKDQARASGQAYITGGASLSCHAQAADQAYICGAKLSFGCKAYGSAVIVPAHKAGRAPMLGGEIIVYGRIVGDVRVSGRLVVLENERLINRGPDILLLNNGLRSIIPADARQELKPLPKAPARRAVKNNVIEIYR